MKRYPSLLQTIVVLSAVIFAALSSCQEESGELGINVLPVVDSASFNSNPVDTTTLHTYTIPGENASEAGIHNAMIGRYNDPVFGRTTADFAIKFYPSTYSFPFDEVAPIDTTEIDSIKLFLSYSRDTIGKIFGVRNRNISYEIFPLISDLKKEDKYNRDSLEYHTKTSVVADEFVPMQQNDTLYTVKLNRLFAQLLINPDKKEAYTSSTNFTEEFPGLYMKLKDAAEPGVITYFNPYHEDSKIRIYYRNTADQDTTHFDYKFDNGYCANMFTHETGGTPVEEQFNENPLTADSISYIQSMGGARTLIKLPSIKNWQTINGKNIIINKAELVVTPTTDQQTGAGIVEQPFELMLMRRVFHNGRGVKYPLQEYLTQQTYNGESKNPETGNYHFVITNYIQKLIKGEEPNNGLYLMVRNNKEDAGRILINGGEKETGVNPTKLRINYGILE